MTTYKEAKSKIYNEESFKEQIEITRKENNVKLGSAKKSEYLYQWIPFNLEREFIDFLIENKRYKEAKENLEKMKLSYDTVEFENFIESYEYRLNNIEHSNKNIQEQVLLAKQEFNNHTTLIISVIIGIITIFGVANNQLDSNSFTEGIANFSIIVLSIMILVFFAFYFNNKYKK